MRAALLLIAAAIISGEATAQTTRCRWVFGTWTCDQQSSPQIDFSQQRPAPNAGQSFMNGYAQGQAMRAEAVRGRVGKMVANGDCAGAEQYAAANGDFDLAGQVRAYCAR